MAPLIPSIVSGIHRAFSIATAATFSVGIVSAASAAVIVLLVLPRDRIGDYEAGCGRSVHAERSYPRS